MKVSPIGPLAVVALCAGLISQAVWSAADSPVKPGEDAPAPDEIIVRAKALEKLRLEIKRSEEAVYARFNDINSNDLYDIHCYARRQFMSHINETVCLSNAWRKFDQAIAESMIRDMQGVSSGSVGGTSTGFAQASRANQLMTEQKIKYEADVDWTIPEAWGQCTLNVRATRETTFALYEFE